MALSFSQLYWLARSVGLSHEDARIAAAVAMAESAGNPGAIGDRGTSYGLWQVHLPAHPWAASMNMLDPYQNALAMARISGGGKNWKPWTTYRTGAYKRYLAEPTGEPTGIPGAMTTQTAVVIDRPNRTMVIPTGGPASQASRLRAAADIGASPPGFSKPPAIVPMLVKQGTREVYATRQSVEPGVAQGGQAPSGQGFENLNPEFARRLAALMNAVPGLKVTSGYRSVQEQAYLWEKYGRNPRRVAPPGRSKHNYGLAADISGPPEAMRRAHELAPKFGLVFPMSWEPWHIELAGAKIPSSSAGQSVAAPQVVTSRYYARTYLPFAPIVYGTQSVPRYDIVLTKMRDLGLLSV
jgi:hypothetical protein